MCASNMRCSCQRLLLGPLSGFLFSAVPSPSLDVTRHVCVWERGRSRAGWRESAERLRSEGARGQSVIHVWWNKETEEDGREGMALRRRKGVSSPGREEVGEIRLKRFRGRENIRSECLSSLWIWRWMEAGTWGSRVCHRPFQEGKRHCHRWVDGMRLRAFLHTWWAPRCSGQSEAHEGERHGPCPRGAWVGSLTPGYKAKWQRVLQQPWACTLRDQHSFPKDVNLSLF